MAFSEIGSWVGLPNSMSFEKVEEFIEPEFLRRGDGVKIRFADGETRKLTFTGGYNGYWPMRYFFWQINDYEFKTMALAAKASVITAIYLQPGKVIVNFSIDPIMPEMVRKICRQRGQSQLTAEYF